MQETLMGLFIEGLERIITEDAKTYPDPIPGIDFKWLGKKPNYYNWIRNYCETYDKSLPKGFSRKTKEQLIGMYIGIQQGKLREETRFRELIYASSGLIGVSVSRKMLDLMDLKRLSKIYDVIWSDESSDESIGTKGNQITQIYFHQR